MTGRAEAQTMYQSHASLPPLVLDFHFKMLEVELKESHPNLEFLRQVYENAAMQFGQKNSGTNEKIEICFYTTLNVTNYKLG